MTAAADGGGRGLHALQDAAATALDAAHYYWKLDIPGNYYGWGQIGPFCASLLLVARAARRARPGLVARDH